MERIVQVVSVATGGWTYHFGITADQAKRILSASVGEEIKLNEPGEVLKIWDVETICHLRQVRDGMKHEELVRSSVLQKLEELILDRAWDE
jgi:hypothetical protein